MSIGMEWSNLELSIMAKLLLLFSTVFLAMMLRTASAQADCPNGEDYSPCTCLSEFRITCQSIALTEVENVFRRTTTTDLWIFYLFLQPTHPTIEIIPADLLNHHRTYSIYIICQPVGSSLILDSQALRSSQSLMNEMYLSDCDVSQLNFDFLSGFNKFASIYWSSMSNVGQANWASFPQLPSFENLRIYQSTGLNEWMTFPQWAKGLTYLEIRTCDIQDEAMNRLLNWTRQYSANTLNFLYIDQNELTQIPKQLQAPNSFPNLRLLFLIDQKTGIPLITTGALSCPSNYSNYVLDARNNRITTIDAGAFQGNCGNAFIYLGNNMLCRFEEATFKEVLIQIGSSTNKGKLFAANNPFNCELDTCHLAWLIRDNRDLLNHFEGAVCSNGTLFTELNPSESVSHTTTKAPAPTTPNDHCTCNTVDHYGNEWIIQPNETKVQNCTEGAVGNATWKCDYVNGQQCQFNTNQPDYSKCYSLKLIEISDLVMDNETEILDIWIEISNFTSRPDAYFGHEIFYIADLLTQLLNRQESEMLLDSIVEMNNLPLQINASLFGTETIDNLISNDAQWLQLIDAKRGEGGILKLLEVSNDVAFRLSNVAQLEDQSLLCEFSFLNVTISSSYWNGSTNPILNCDSNSTSSDDFLRFPLFKFNDNEESNETKSITNSYIRLPSSILVPNQVYKASGVLIADSNLIRLLLPGENNSPGKVEKQVNSPLITFTLYAAVGTEVQLPENSHMQIVYEHGVAAKYPPVHNIYRWLDEGEQPSSVMGSSLCSYLLLNQTTYSNMDSNSNNNMSSIWKWDDKGCRVASSNRTHTVCHCDHLTGFANLMDFHNYLGPSKALDITSMACTIISIIGVAMTFFILEAFRSTKIKRKARTQNLCANFFISFLMILITLNKRFIPLDDVTCAVMGILLHYVLLVSFMWIFIEGFHLYRLTKNAIKVNATNWIGFYAFLAYGGPFIVVGITVLCAVVSGGIIEVYSGDETCWLVGEIWMWSFGGPVAAILLGNCIIAIFILRAMCKMGSNSKDSVEDQFWKSLRRLIVLTFLLGITWITGFLLYSETLVLAYIFTITSGLQGVAIFFTCCLTKDILTALKMNFQRFNNYTMGKLRYWTGKRGDPIRNSDVGWKDGDRSAKNEVVNESPMPPNSDLGSRKRASLNSGSSQDTGYSYASSVPPINDLGDHKCTSLGSGSSQDTS